MNVLVDTNLLTRIAESQHPQNPTAADAVRVLAARGDLLYVAPQNSYEFWVVATQPLANNGLGMAPKQAKAELRSLQLILTLLPDVPAIFDEWERLVEAYDCKGKIAHDARLVAAMRVHGMSHLLTFNVVDFSRYAEIQIINPHDPLRQLSATP